MLHPHGKRVGGHATEEAGRHSPLANRGDPERHAHGRTGLYVGPLLAPNVFSP